MHLLGAAWDQLSEFANAYELPFTAMSARRSMLERKLREIYGTSFALL